MTRTRKTIGTALAISALMVLIAIWASAGPLLAETSENNPATGSPRIEGAMQLGEELYACALACISDADGMTKATISYQWIRRDGTTDTDITNATGALYTIVAADVGKNLRVRASFTDDAGNPEKLTSAATQTVSGTRNSPTTGAPSITGTARVGQTLSVDTSGIADADGLTKVSYSGIWRAGDHFRVLVRQGESLSYRVTRGDLALPLKVTLDFTDDAGKSVTLESAPTAAVAPISPAAPELFAVSRDAFGDPEVIWENPVWDFGGELDGRSTWGDGGSAITGYVVQWKETADSWDTDADVSEATVTLRRYTIPNLTAGQAYSIRVLAVNSVGRGIPTDEAFITMDQDNSGQFSSDATLSALALRGVDFGAFAPGTTSYTAQVDNSVSRTVVVLALGHSRATYVIKLGGVAGSGGVIDLSEGSNIITIEVTAEDRQMTLTYTVTVTRNTSSGGGETPTPPPESDSCTDDIGTLAGTSSRSGTWADNCQSEVSGRGYARYYSFTLTQDSEATIGLTSTVDTYLYLREGSATSVTALHSNDDVESSNTNSRIVADLNAGIYTIEATTYAEATTGSFTLSVSGGGTQTPVNTGCTPTSLTLPVSGASGSWSDDCESKVLGRGYARYYSFTLTQNSDVTIDLSSDDVDTYLYLRDGSATSGDSLHDNDDIESGNTSSRIADTLTAGTYTIEATTYAEDAAGSFTLSISGGSGVQAPVNTGCTPTSLTLPANGVSGSWSDDCESNVSGRGYAQYYSFTLTEEAEVIIDLTSDIDTYLYLREGDATTGDFLHDNDDIESGNTNSRISETLEAATYTIEATTYAEDTEGGFTLSVSSGGTQTPVTTDCTPAALTLPATGVAGTWTNNCQSEVSGRGYARYYTFTLSRDGEVIIDLASDVDTYLYLREGSATSGNSLYSNDDYVSGSFDSQIVADLETGTYTIEATTHAEFAVGSFTLSVGGRATRQPVVTACTPTLLTLPAAGVEGSWVADCQSGVSGRGHARYYTFTLAQHSDVTIGLTSTADTYLYLRGGDASAGEPLHENNDVADGNLNSQIAETLVAGTYTIEATTKNEAVTGTFTLSVSSTETQTPVAVGCDPATLTLPAASIPGSWAPDCKSSVSGRGWARFYTFTLDQSNSVTIDLASTVDTHLYLREGDATTGGFLHENDDIESGNTNSQITETLKAGTYTIETTTHSEATTGSFTLSVSAVAAPLPVDPDCAPASLTLPAAGVSGSWADDCESTVSGRGYARFYTFTLDQDAQVTIDLASDNIDTYLYLRAGSAISGTRSHENDDIDGGNRNSRVIVDLDAGTYTIEATTYYEGDTGSFTVSATEAHIPVAVGCDPATLTLPAASIPGSWAPDCKSGISGRGWARFYTFTLDQSNSVTIDLASTVDTYLYLREGDATTGDFLHENDDIESGNTNSRISGTLEAGTYTIETTTHSEATTGSFTLSVSTVAPLPADPDCAPESLTLPAAGVSGSWADDCESTVSGRGYARFYTFTLDEDAQVTIDLASDHIDTYLYLRAGSAISGTHSHENDDITGDNRNSQIVADLEAGTYTIEATIYHEGDTGSFTLSVSSG